MDLEAQIKRVEREIGIRERVYPSFVARGKMKQEVAERELATMRAVRDTLISLRAPRTFDPTGTEFDPPSLR